MGLNFFSSSSIFDTSAGGSGNKTPRYKVATGNPDPRRFRILDTKQVGKHLVMRIRYEDVTNYEGIKILLFKNLTPEQLFARQVEIDPHFSSTTYFYSPFARFEPTEEGWKVAVECAERLK